MTRGEDLLGKFGVRGRTVVVIPPYVLGLAERA
jgi:hypothetical protein